MHGRTTTSQACLSQGSVLVFPRGVAAPGTHEHRTGRTPAVRRGRQVGAPAEVDVGGTADRGDSEAGKPGGGEAFVDPWLSAWSGHITHVTPAEYTVTRLQADAPLITVGHSRESTPGHL
jgi:hypothetical protein